MLRALRLEIRGRVQGLGFRPSLFRLSEKNHLKGYCLNTGYGVELVWEGPEDDINKGLSMIKAGEGLPSLSKIDSISCFDIEFSGYKDFTVHESSEGTPSSEVLPDMAPCSECLREMNDPSEKRYMYPFLNCTECGPRFSIIEKIPYDRKNTSMKMFPKCAKCGREYNDISDRRFHAEPVCCPECGPRLWIKFSDGEILEGDSLYQIKRLSEELLKGRIAAIKGIAGFHLACDAGNLEAVKKLREKKRRLRKPLALMARDINTAEKLCEISDAEKSILLSKARPIVLLRKKNPQDLSSVSDRNTLGIMLPYTPFHEMLFLNSPLSLLVMTSANMSSLPMITENEDAEERLKGIADLYLFHNRKIVSRCDDSVLRLRENGSVCFIRRSRGYVPLPVELSFDTDNIIAFGAEEKAGFAIGKGRKVILSAHIGDLKNMETLSSYEESLNTFKKIFEPQPKTFACDMHPDFLSTRLCREYGKNGKIERIQHHHAHMASVMAENLLDGRLIGIIWDGTGINESFEVLGSEFLYGGYSETEYITRLMPIPLPGGDICIRECGRISRAMKILSGCRMDEKTNDMISLMLKNNINVSYSSGMGRLFDGVYSLITDENTSDYEGEMAEKLENLAENHIFNIWKDRDFRGEKSLRSDIWKIENAYPIVETEEGLFDWRPMVRELCKETDPESCKASMDRKGKSDIGSPEEKAFRFHTTLIFWALRISRLIRQKTGEKRVVLSGGVFINRLLSEGISYILTGDGFEVFENRSVSPGDEGISLGQIAVSAHRRQKEG